MRCVLRSLWLVAVATAFACSPASLGAKDDERFALDFLQLVRTDRTDAALTRMDPALRIPSTRSALEQVHRSLPAGEPLRVDTTGLFLVIAALAFGANAAAVVVCALSRIRRKLVWLLISALGAGQILVDWTTGATTSRPFSLQLFSVGMTRGNEYAPWILSVSLPLGALLFFGMRQKLTQQQPAPPPPG